MTVEILNEAVGHNPKQSYRFVQVATLMRLTKHSAWTIGVKIKIMLLLNYITSKYTLIVTKQIFVAENFFRIYCPFKAIQCSTAGKQVIAFLIGVDDMFFWEQERVIHTEPRCSSPCSDE